MSSCEACPASPSSFGPLSSLESPSRLSAIAGTCALIASTPPQMSIITVMWFSMNRIVLMTLLMRRRVHLAERACRLVDRFGRLEDLLGRLFGAADDSA